MQQAIRRFTVSYRGLARIRFGRELQVTARSLSVGPSARGSVAMAVKIERIDAEFAALKWGKVAGVPTPNGSAFIPRGRSTSVPGSGRSSSPPKRRPSPLICFFIQHGR